MEDVINVQIDGISHATKGSYSEKDEILAPGSGELGDRETLALGSGL